MLIVTHCFTSCRSVFFGLIGLSVARLTTTLQTQRQVAMNVPMVTESDGWTVYLSREWEVLGPFPIHAREQHFLSPSFPLNLSEPIDLDRTWPSSYVDGGSVGWSKACAGKDGLIEVSYPAVRWASLRATEGWAALQHHSVLRSTLIVHPPSRSHSLSEPQLLVNLFQGSFFTILPSPDAVGEAVIPEWHAGNIYALGKAPPNALKLPHPPSLDSPTTYQIVVSGDYEIRLFGDPRSILGTEVPKLSVTLAVDVQDSASTVIRDESHDVVGDFVGGWAFGNAVGIGLRSLGSWWTVTGATVSTGISENLTVSLLEKQRIGPTQTRVIPVVLIQTSPVYLDELEIILRLESGDAESEVFVTIPLLHHPQWSADSVPAGGIKATFFYGTSMPSAFLVLPPEEPRNVPLPPILALHGAGVDIFHSDRFWIKALPRQQHSWLIAPAGRTEWGLDWHGSSTQDAWSAVEALCDILASREEWNRWSLAPKTKVLVMGHSNGGQGAWYVAARYPDRVVGVVPAAAYIKSQAYVPWVQSRSAHYVDPSLRAILDSSLTPDDNDLFLSNLAATPILAIHGGNDDNVPVWHTRALISTLKTWNPHANVTFREDSEERHWYPDVFKNDEVAAFVSSTLSGQDAGASIRTFTLTVAVPSDSGSLHGWSIYRLGIPGRLGRLTVNINPDGISVETSNIGAFSYRPESLPKDVKNAPFLVDGQRIELDEATWDQPNFSLALVQEKGVWTPHALFDVATTSLTGRISNLLSSTSPITIVVPNRLPSPESSAALRIAHNLNVYHKLDVGIIDADEADRAVRDGSLASGNLVVLSYGKLRGFAASLLSKSATPFGVDGTTLRLRSRSLTAPSTGVLFLHPHPTNPEALALVIYGTDVSGLERALRLFPIRTGVTVPDWIVVGSQADARGTGGVQSAGVWGNDWSWNEAMSAF
ncbi:hypothetical protein GSI_13480 [Ganoderma sinense ZZ0214-1]|uniref:Peptidase S9 prolyl oligopeptidase catalytic domain-containing protein n=1 Tax=Ganoderma sinense ZZ0214-1 TaxID=1077348 RepID=A0A2G8RQD5_9APHY|nr:hypothetical protein GSI_13480 [Ganoderma sinense ZZ0214-1]